MNTLILYTSTYGFTKECAEELKGQLLGEVTVINAGADAIPSLDGFDTVILGSSVYIGQINKKLKAFIDANVDALSQKRLGLFLCCGLPDNLDQVLSLNFPETLRDKAVIECFGGELRTEKMKLGHKMMTAMMKKVTAKEGKPEPKKLPEKITAFANKMNIA